MNDSYSAAFEKAKKEYEAGRWSKAMLRMLVQRKPQRLTESEYNEITGETDT
nr:MAG TPA: chaperone [Caudoviricetes sp.]